MSGRAGRLVWALAEASLTRGSASARDLCCRTAATFLAAVGKQTVSLRDSGGLLRVLLAAKEVCSGWQSHAVLGSETLLMHSQVLFQLASAVPNPRLEGPQHPLKHRTGVPAALGCSCLAKTKSLLPVSSHIIFPLASVGLARGGQSPSRPCHEVSSF